MKHKLKIWKGRRRDLWYVKCLSGCCATADVMPPVDGSGLVGRSTWDAAFALGVAHQKDRKEVCNCG